MSDHKEQTVDVVSRTVEVDGQTIHYLEAGTGAPVVFLHGNPTSSYLWRDVLPVVAASGRCLAMDLIGMGRSGKPDIPYRLWDHAAYLDGFIDALGLHDITFVTHDWGMALGLHYLSHHADRVRAFAFMEGHLHPIERWEDMDAGSREMFDRLRDDEAGRRMIVDENVFIEVVLPSGVVEQLGRDDMDAYRAPFRVPASREVIRRWVREIPIAGQPADIDALVRANQRLLSASPIPKLLFHASPGALIGGAEVAWCRANLTDLTVVDLGHGLHFLPEDHGPAIGRAVADWMGREPGGPTP